MSGLSGRIVKYEIFPEMTPHPRTLLAVQPFVGVQLYMANTVLIKDIKDNFTQSF